MQMKMCCATGHQSINIQTPAILFKFTSGTNIKHVFAEITAKSTLGSHSKAAQMISNPRNLSAEHHEAN